MLLRAMQPRGRWRGAEAWPQGHVAAQRMQRCLLGYCVYCNRLTRMLQGSQLEGELLLALLFLQALFLLLLLLLLLLFQRPTERQGLLQRALSLGAHTRMHKGCRLLGRLQQPGLLR